MSIWIMNVIIRLMNYDFSYTSRNWFAKFGENFIPPQTVNIMVWGGGVWGDYYSFTSLVSPTHGSICVFYWKSSKCLFLPWIPPRAASPLKQYRTTFCWLVFWHRPETQRHLTFSISPLTLHYCSQQCYNLL